MNDERISVLVAELDALVPREGAYIVDDHGLYGSEHDPGYTGNRLGYLRFGIELLKVADASPGPSQADRVLVDLSYLSDADIRRGDLAIFDRREITPDWRLHQSRPPARLLQVAQGLLALGLVALLLIAVVLGLRDVMRWVSGLLAA